FHTQNYRELKIRPYDPSTYWTSRIDQKFSDKDQVFGRYTWSRLYNRVWEGNLPTIGQRWQQRDDRAATVSHNHRFRCENLRMRNRSALDQDGRLRWPIQIAR